MTLPSRDDQRSTERYAGARDATLRDSEASPQDAVVEDLSRTGFRLAPGAMLTLGDRISIGLPGIGRRAAQVLRVGDDGIGCTFDVPLAPGEMERALTTAPLTPLALPTQIMSRSGEAQAATSPAFAGPVRLAILVAGVALPWAAILLLAR